MCYITYFIPKLSSSDRSIFDSIGSNEIISSNTFYIFLFALFGVTEGVINRKFSNDKSGMLRLPILFDQLKRMKITFKSEVLFMKPIEKFRKGFRKLCSVFKLRKSLKERINPLEDNPLRRKFFFLITFWVSIHFIVYMHMISMANTNQNETIIESISNFFSKPDLRNSKNWEIIRIFYFLCICYMYVNISQIHYGKEIFKSLVVDLTVKESLSHTVSDLTPFFREIGVVMDFLANKSSLQLRHKLRFNDITYNIRTAKKQEQVRNNTSFGKPPVTFMKFIVGLIWFFLLVIILFGPLLPFTSIFNNNSPLFIKDASMQVHFADETKRTIGRIFETQTNSQNHDPEIQKREYNELVNQKFGAPIEKYNPETFEILTMNKQSETRPNLEDKFFSVLSTNSQEAIYNIIIKGSLVFKLTVVLKDDKLYEFQQEVKFSEGRSKEADELTNLLVSKCEAVNVKRTILIDKISQIFETERKDDKQFLRRPDLNSPISESYKYTKLSINCDCDSGRLSSSRKEKAVLNLQRRSRENHDRLLDHHLRDQELARLHREAYRTGDRGHLPVHHRVPVPRSQSHPRPLLRQTLRELVHANPRPRQNDVSARRDQLRPVRRRPPQVLTH